MQGFELYSRSLSSWQVSKFCKWERTAKPACLLQRCVCMVLPERRTKLLQGDDLQPCELIYILVGCSSINSFVHVKVYVTGFCRLLVVERCKDAKLNPTTYLQDCSYRQAASSHLIYSCCVPISTRQAATRAVNLNPKALVSTPH